MKKFSDAITVISFFTILVMFAVSVLFFSGNKDFELSGSDPGEVRDAVNDYVDSNFPLSANWRSLYANLMLLTGRVQFDDVFYTDERLIRSYDSIDLDNGMDNADKINTLADMYLAPVYVMLSPTAAGIYSADLPEYAADDEQKDSINKIYMELDKKVGTIDAYYPLYSARDEYIFYRTEDLWTSFGAYYAYCGSVGQLGLEASKLQNYDQEYASSSFTGSLYAKAMCSGILPDRINIFRSKYQSPVESVELEKNGEVKKSGSVYFRSALKSGRQTDIFLQGDNYERVTVRTASEDAPTLLVIKGSFANTLIPFYTPHYREITLIDPELVKKAGKNITDYVNPNRYDQILVMYDVESFCEADCFDVLTAERKSKQAESGEED